MNPSKNRQRGKRTEKAIAKRIGGKRIGILGKSDVEHACFSFEVKSRKKFVAEKWMLQAERNCEEGKTPAVIVHILRLQHKNDLVIIRLKDFEDFLGKIKMGGLICKQLEK